MFKFGDFLTKLGETHHVSFLIYNPIVWSRFFYSSRRSGKLFANAISKLFPDIHSLCDVGAGTGGYVLQLRRSGFHAEGLEYSSVGRAIAKWQGVHLIPFDCSCIHNTVPLGRFDAVFTIEVGEHIPESLTGVFVDYIISRSDLVIFSAAFPGQGGQGHINEQPKEYWAEQFSKRGYVYEEQMSSQFSNLLVANGFRGWLPHNLQIFKKAQITPSLESGI